jgi:hypothetical protein
MDVIALKEVTVMGTVTVPPAEHALAFPAVVMGALSAKFWIVLKNTINIVKPVERENLFIKFIIVLYYLSRS